MLRAQLSSPGTVYTSQMITPGLFNRLDAPIWPTASPALRMRLYTACNETFPRAGAALGLQQPGLYLPCH
jgi:hypothetical protein